MRAPLNAFETYSRIDLQARIEGSQGSDLTRICFDALCLALGTAALARSRNDRLSASQAISRALAILAGLQSSVDAEAPMASTLADFYASISLRLRQLTRTGSGEDILAVRDDLADVAGVLVPDPDTKAREESVP